MSFLYPRTCTITRARAPAMLDVGDLGYSGHVASTNIDVSGEDVIAANLPCSIQAKATGRAASGGLLPGDAAGPVHWRFFFPKRALAKGVARDRDIVTDDLGDRYQISAAYWNSLGVMFDTLRLES